ncbi:MAG: peptidyl-prolyl cis-trans isomerase [Acidobacteriota bacterium]
MPSMTLPRTLLVLAFLLAAPPALGETVYKVVMNVNDEILSLYDYEERKKEFEQQLLAQDNLPTAQRRQILDELPKRVFRLMFEELLLISRAKQTGVFISEEDVDRQLDRIRESFGIETESDFQRALQQNGMTLDDFREQTRRQAMIDNLLYRDVSATLEVPDEVVRRIYRENPEDFQDPERLRLQEIVVLEDSDLSADERSAVADEIRGAVAAGGDLAEIAEARSAAGETSGLIALGWVSPGDLAPELEEPIWKLQSGEISAPIEARGGLHLVKVLEREEASEKPFSEVQEAIRRREQGRLYADALAEYMDRLESEAWVKLDPPPEAEGFRQTATVRDETLPEPVETAEEAAEEQMEASAEEAAAPPEDGLLPSTSPIPTGDALDEVRPDPSPPSD